MNKVQQWIALTVAGVLLIMAGAWFLLISPKRSDAAEVRATTETQLSTNASLRTQLSVLKAQAKDLPAQQAKLAAVAAKIPDNPALPSLIRALADAADQAGVELVSMTPAAPAPVTAAAASTAAVTPTAPSSATDKAAATAAAAASTATAAGAATAAAGASAVGSLQQISVTLNVVGGYFQIAQFTDRLENLSRSFKVIGLTAIPGANPAKPVAVGAQPNLDSGKSLAASISGQVYMAYGRVSSAISATPAK